MILNPCRIFSLYTSDAWIPHLWHGWPHPSLQLLCMISPCSRCIHYKQQTGGIQAMKLLHLGCVRVYIYNYILYVYILIYIYDMYYLYTSRVYTFIIIYIIIYMFIYIYRVHHLSSMNQIIHILPSCPAYISFCGTYLAFQESKDRSLPTRLAPWWPGYKSCISRLGSNKNKLKW